MLKQNKLKIILSSILVLGTISFYIFSNKEETIHVLASADYPVTENLDEMAIESDLVVMGKYVKLDSKWNMARNPKDISQEDPENYVEGHIYTFKVDYVVKGNIQNKKMIEINHRYSETIDIEDGDGNVEKATNLDPLYIQPDLNAKYVVFLKYEPTQNHYYKAIEPFTVKINELDKVELQSNLLSSVNKAKKNEFKAGNKTFIIDNEIHKIQDNISGMSIEELKSKINQKK
ncbi:cardiolipin synthase [Fictibacillus barbaricus]|uniref:Cardiolipin synthase n=1 Tax=Fictibacillus barbaricus TaxID=182136 RepID=A0ABS2Z7Q2_9BACL|nr:cardiolipin synthase [Fictibacillus barbaricus]MBN3543735.1 cardiolipin synthase [Fictibacillus barbaricus]GGB72890.1 hypothetical protein GCM10007199_43830 [Fictibacillus barbaricus]